MQATTVERSIWIDAPRDRAWEAVTKPEHLNQWYATSYHWEIPAMILITTVTFYNKDDRADSQVATIEIVDPPRQFTLRWQPDKQYPAMILITTLRLVEENGGTRVTIHESGYEAIPENERQEWFDATTNGYTMSMENLKAYLEGRSISY
jgi:uncharacterized protein YndB with AHSA1/START domain